MFHEKAIHFLFSPAHTTPLKETQASINHEFDLLSASQNLKTLIGLVHHDSGRLSCNDEELVDFLGNVNKSFKSRFKFPGNHFMYKDMIEICYLGRDEKNLLHKMFESRSLSYFSRKVLAAINYKENFQNIVLSEIVPLMNILEIPGDELQKVVRINYKPGESLEIISDLGLGTLEDLIGFMKNRGLAFKNLADELFNDINREIILLSNSNYVHRDIDPSKIIVTRDFHFKLSDFSTSEKVETHEKHTMKMRGHPKYMMPEVLEQLEKHAKTCFMNPYAADEYAFNPCKSKGYLLVVI